LDHRAANKVAFDLAAARFSITPFARDAFRLQGPAWLEGKRVRVTGEIRGCQRKPQLVLESAVDTRRRAREE